MINNSKLDKNWIAGFFTGEGCFNINIYKSKTHKIGYDITCNLIIGQHYKDFCLIIDIMNKGNHLTLKGLEEIKLIKSKMNRARSI